MARGKDAFDADGLLRLAAEAIVGRIAGAAGARASSPWKTRQAWEPWRHGERRTGVRRVRPSLLVLFSALAVVVSACSDGDAQVVSATTNSTSSPVEADTSWLGAILSVDGLTLELDVGSQPDGDGPCEQRFQHEVTETEDAVTVAFDLLEQTTPPTGPVGGCNLMLQPQHFEIRLDAPLGDRTLYDGVQPQPQQVWRLAEVVEPTVLPDGVTADDLVRSPGGDLGPVHWSQYAEVRSGPGWDLWIDQGPAGSFTPPSTEPGEVIATTEIHGIEAAIYEYFNHTGHMVHWTEGGLDITVRAELHTVNMSEPLSFANPDVAFIDDVLIRVAGGIAIP